MDTQMLIVVTGLPGSGKTTFAISLTECLGFSHFNSDIIRKELGVLGRYDTDTKHIVYDALMRKVDDSLREGKSVVLDATFYNESVRKPIINLSKISNTAITWIEIRAADHVIKERMKHKRLYSEADYSVYLKIKKEYEPLTFDHLVLRSDQLTISEMTEKALSYLSKSPKTVHHDIN